MEQDKEAELNFQGKLEQYKQHEETKRALITSVGTFAIQALRGIFLLNGGGAVAVLAHVQGAQSHPYAVKYFASGALCAVLATGSAYLTELFAAAHFEIIANNIFLENPAEKRKSKALLVTSFIFLCLSIALFLISCTLFAAQAFGISEAFREFQNATHNSTNCP
jgi:hypothetical protein